MKKPAAVQMAAEKYMADFTIKVQTTELKGASLKQLAPKPREREMKLPEGERGA